MMPAAVNDYLEYAIPPHGPARNAAAVAASDTVDLANVSRWIYVGVAGDITLDLAGGQTAVLFKAVPAGTQLQVAATRVRATGTTATNLTACW
jgi:hypothetical protein